MGRRSRILEKDIERRLPDGSIVLKEGVAYTKPYDDETELTAKYINEPLMLKKKLSEIDGDFDFSIRT